MTRSGTTHESNWIRDGNGNLVNLERVGEIRKVKLEQGLCEVVFSPFDSDETGVLYRGPENRADALLFGVAVILSAWDVETIIETTLEEKHLEETHRKEKDRKEKDHEEQHLEAKPFEEAQEDGGL